MALLQDKGDKQYEVLATASKNLRQGAKDLGHALITVASLVKDGSVRGSKEIEYAQDETWRLEEDQAYYGKEKIIKMIPNKQRHGGAKAFVRLEMKPGLPWLEEK